MQREDACRTKEQGEPLFAGGMQALAVSSFFALVRTCNLNENPAKACVFDHVTR